MNLPKYLNITMSSHIFLKLYYKILI